MNVLYHKTVTLLRLIVMDQDEINAKYFDSLIFMCELLHLGRKMALLKHPVEWGNSVLQWCP